MSDEELKECVFINTEMKFYTYKDFIENCSALRRLYNSLGKNAKIFYKWYVYANIHLTINQKNKAWEYLNYDINKKDLKRR